MLPLEIRFWSDVSVSFPESIDKMIRTN